MTADEYDARCRVRDEALTWLRTPYHHHGRVKGVGVDCGQLLAAVYEAAGVIDPIDPRYVQDWHLHRDRDLFVEFVESTGAKPIDPDRLGMGDIIVWKWGRAFSHGAIVLTPPQVLHSYVGVGVTIDDMTTHGELSTRESRCFSFW